MEKSVMINRHRFKNLNVKKAFAENPEEMYM